MFTQVSGFEEEKTELQRELATTTSRLVDAKATVCELEEENVRGNFFPLKYKSLLGPLLWNLASFKSQSISFHL